MVGLRFYLDVYKRQLPICEKIKHAGYSVDLFVFPAGEKSKSRETKAKIEDAMLKKGYRRDSVSYTHLDVYKRQQIYLLNNIV